MNPRQHIESMLKGVPHQKWDLKVIEQKSGIDLVLSGSFRLAAPIEKYLKSHAFTLQKRQRTAAGYVYTSRDPLGNVARSTFGKSYTTELMMRGAEPPKQGWVKGKRGGWYRKTPQGLKLYKKS